MKIFLLTILSITVFACPEVSAQNKKERIFICRSNLYEDEHTTDQKFNRMVDSACIEINLKHYSIGLQILSEAIEMDSTNTGITNEYFKAQRNKLTNFIKEEDARNKHTVQSEPQAPVATEQEVAGDDKTPEKEPIPAAEPVKPVKKEKVKAASRQKGKASDKTVVENVQPSEKMESVNEVPVDKIEANPAPETEIKSEPKADSVEVKPIVEEPVSTQVADPEPVSEPISTPPVEPVSSPETSINFEENNSPTEVKSFTEEEREEFHAKGMQKVKSLERYIQQLSNIHTSQIVADEALENAVGLFDNEDRTVEISTLRSPEKIKLKVRKYFQKLQMIPYDKVSIEWADLQYTSDFRKGVDGNYYGYIIFRQRFKAEKDQVVVYKDLTTKKTEIILKPYNKNIEGQAVQNWEVFLGDISVEQTEKY